MPHVPIRSTRGRFQLQSTRCTSQSSVDGQNNIINQNGAGKIADELDRGTVFAVSQLSQVVNEQDE